MTGNGDDDDREQYLKSVEFWRSRAVIEKESN